MAREEVSGKVGETKKPNTLKVGEEIEGYFLRTEDSQMYPGNLSLIMRDKAGNLFRVASHGNIKFALKDGSIVPGRYTWIVALGPVTVKGKATTKYRIDQDAADTTEIPLVGFDAIESSASSSSPTSSIRASVEKSSNAALQANKVRQAMGRS